MPVLTRWVGAACVAGALAAATPALAQSAPEPRFDVFEFVVEGNTVLANETIERAVYPFLGEQRVFGDVDAARSALERAYRDRGFGNVTVFIPEQRVDGAVIRLQVQEGRIARVRVTGARYFSQGYILAQVPSAAEGQVPHFPTLQSELGKVNRTADRRVKPLLRPGRVAGTTELDLEVEDRLPLHGSVEVNNRASPNTSETRLLASLRYDNLLQRDHSLGLQVQVSPERSEEVQVLTATYAMPAGPVGQDTLLLSATVSDSQVPAGVGDITVLGKGRIFGLRRTLTLALGESEFHMLTLGVDYKDFDQTISAGEAGGFSTPITYLPLSANWLGSYTLDRGRWQFGAGLSVGLRGLVNEPQEFDDARYSASASYMLVRLDAMHERRFGNEMSLVASASAQLTAQPLVSNEQFVAGGVGSVRGYLESVASGDQGLRASIELRSRELARPTWTWLSSLRGHVFADGAATLLHDVLPGQDDRAGLIGAGFGLRAALKPRGSLGIDFGWALREQGTTRQGDLRVHASGTLEF